MRKVVGAERKQLVVQFLGESLLVSCISLAGAAILARAVMPWFSTIVEVPLVLDLATLGHLLLWLLALTAVVGVGAGLYPAFHLARFRPVEVFQAEVGGPGGGGLRRILVVAQFAICIALIAGSLVVYRQLDFIRAKDLGFDREHFVVLPLFEQDRESKTNRDPWLAGRYNAVKEAFLANPGVVSASAFRFLPGQSGGMVRIVKPEGHEGTEWRMPVQEADEDFLSAFGAKLLAGRTFAPNVERDRGFAYILNETAVKALGWTVEDAVGRRFGRARFEEDANGTVIGVVGDFHYASLRERIQPAAIAYRNAFYNFLGLRIRGDSIPETMAFLETTWKRLMSPDLPFTVSFLDDEIDVAYQGEVRQGQIAGAFSLLAIFLACLGLLGLASFTAARRTREMGIRRVLGASVWGVVALLTGDFAKLVLVSTVVSWPVAYYATLRWLESFAYRVDLGMSAFVSASLISLAIALVTVGSLALRAARANPAEVLRHE